MLKAFNQKKFVRELVSTGLLVLTIFALKSSLASTYRVPTPSMVPTIVPGDHLIADQRKFGLRIPFTGIHITEAKPPQRGDIVMFPSPIEDVTLVKRVVAVGGDVIEVHDGRITLNGKPEVVSALGASPEGYELFDENLEGYHHKIQVDERHPSLREFPPFEVPANQFFVMGDNRDHSADSRYFGAVPVDSLRGKALRVLFSIQLDHFPFFRPERFAGDLI